ncbi:MAG: LysM peptidoglycan-binding domain-containing protein [Caldilineaceae bacterium]|nr:LysM peptidoglycan-binding domain-containing protein [Caldilineaceae bacterium]
MRRCARYQFLYRWSFAWIDTWAPTLCGGTLVALALLGATFISSGQPAVLRAQAVDEPATHTVRVGETLSEIAEAYGVSLQTLMTHNDITNPNQIRVGQLLILPDGAVQIGPPTAPTHTVLAGETLSQIAQRYDVSMTRLMHLNGIDNADAIRIGQVLRLPVLVSDTPTSTPTSPDAPPAATLLDAAPAPTRAATQAAPRGPASAIHIVQAGETLSQIAQQYGVTMQALMEANGIQNANAIYVGQSLRIPSVPATTPTPATGPTVAATFAPDDKPDNEPTDEPAPESAPVETIPIEATADDEPGIEQEDEVGGEARSGIETDAQGDGAAVAPGAERPSTTQRIAGLNRTYTVRRNDTLTGVARRLGVDVDALRRINRIYADRDLVVGQALVVPGVAEDLRVRRPGQEYVVRPGDSLGVIAKANGLTLADLMAANYISNPNTIFVGQRLVIPAIAPEADSTADEARIGPARSGYYYYTVQPGDTLSTLAQQFDSTMLALAEYNGLPNAETVYRGLELRIPYGPPPLPLRLPPVATSGSSFLVSLSRQECWLFWGKAVHHRWRCSTGYGEYITRTGNFAVQTKIENAKSRAYRLDMPYWLGIYYVGNYENGIHGLPVSWDTGEKIWTSLVGQPATFGCAMLADEDAAELFRIAYVGMPVYIID